MKRNFNLTTFTVVISLIAITFFLVYDRTLKSKFDQELFFLLFHFFLTVVLAGIELIGFRIYITEQNRKMARRDNLQRMDDALNTIRLRTILTIRKLRASISFEPGGNQHQDFPIEPDLYQEAMETVIKCHYRFRTTANRIRVDHLGCSLSHRIAD